MCMSVAEYEVEKERYRAGKADILCIPKYIVCHVEPYEPLCEKNIRPLILKYSCTYTTGRCMICRGV